MKRNFGFLFVYLNPLFTMFTVNIALLHLSRFCVFKANFTEALTLPESCSEFR